MSIIAKTNPLNLQFCVCVILNSSCPLGTIISKTLLKANALVLGIDSRPKDDSLNAGLGTHFQFEQKSPEDVSSEQVIKIVQDRYDQERIDVVVNVIEYNQEGHLKNVMELTEGLAKMIAEGGRGKGAILTVMSDTEAADDAQVKQTTDILKELALRYGKKGVRCNVVLGAAAIGGDRTAYEAAKENMLALMRTEKMTKDTTSADEAKQSIAKLYEVGNVSLFLAGDMGENITGAIVARDGSYRDMR